MIIYIDFQARERLFEFSRRRRLIEIKDTLISKLSFIVFNQCAILA